MEISAAEFKAKCLKLMDEVARTRKTVVITKRGKAVARLVPPEAAPSRRPLFGYMSGTATIVGDLVDVPSDAWSAEAADDDELRVPPARARTPRP